MIPQSVRVLVTGAAVLGSGFLALNVVSSFAISALRLANDRERRKTAAPCTECRGKGVYICKLCKGDATISWSPQLDPLSFNPCLCPTCDGNRVQRCLNCIGKGYS